MSNRVHKSRSFVASSSFALALLVSPLLRMTAQDRGATALGQIVEGLGTTARVLMIGAHPDDEDTQLLAWLTRGRHVETARSR